MVEQKKKKAREGCVEEVGEELRGGLSVHSGEHTTTTKATISVTTETFSGSAG